MTKSISQVLAEEPSAFSPSPAAAVGGNISYGSSTQAVTTAEERPVQPSAVGMPETGMTPAPEATRAVEDAATVGDGIGVTATLPVEVMAAAATVEGRGSTERVSNGEGPSGEGVEVDGGAAEAGGEIILDYFRRFRLDHCPRRNGNALNAKAGGHSCDRQGVIW